MLKQTQSIKMLQKLSPQQIQLMKLLQIPTATLDQRIQEELEANPALEEGENEETEEAFGSAAQDETDDENAAEEAETTQEDFELEEMISDYVEDDPVSYGSDFSYSNNGEEEKSIPIPVAVSYTHLTLPTKRIV